MSIETKNLLARADAEPVGTYCIISRDESHDIELSIRKTSPTKWQYIDSAGDVILKVWAKYIVDVEAVIAFS